MLVSSNAREEILRNAKFLKITAQMGGCAGFQYNLEYVNEITDEIMLLDCILTDEVSGPLIEEIELDFINELGCKEFVIKNAKAKNSCGCGNSFST